MSERKHRRLSELARERRVVPAAAGTARTAAAGPDGPSPGGRRLRLESLVPGAEEITSRGRHWRHQRILTDLPVPTLLDGRVGPDRLGESEAREIEAASGRGAEGALFFDLETCGFAGNPLFLAGALWFSRERAVLVQLLARNYAEEASVVEAAAGLLGRFPLLVTFNGKAYDLPFLRDRAVRFGVDLPEPQGHLDLLHAARRRWKGILPDCRLTTLETRLSGLRRTADVPGSEVPARYHAFVQGAPATELVPVLRHNLLDLRTLVSILQALPRPTGPRPLNRTGSAGLTLPGTGARLRKQPGA